jgi:CheY-like chemotaxis protein
VLIVDDDRPVAAAISIELSGYELVVASSGREALEILRRDRDFDVILCDVMMPELSGMDVYEALRVISPELLPRIVLMTGGAFTPRLRQFLTDIPAPVLEKPFKLGQLEAAVQAIPPRFERAATTEPSVRGAGERPPPAQASS